MSSTGPAATRTQAPPDWLAQYGQGIASAAAQAAQQPYQPYTQQRVADLSPLQQQALGGFSQLGQAALPYMGQAANTLGGFIGGDSNPFQQQVADRVTRGVTDQYNNAVSQTSGRFNSPGNFGSARQAMADELNQRALATGLGDSLGGVYSSGYENAANRSLQSVGQLGSLFNTGTGALSTALNAGAVPQQNQQQLLNSLYSDFTEQRQYPWTQLQNAAGLVAPIFGGSMGSTQTTQQSYSPVSQGLGVLSLANQAGNKGGNGGSTTGSAKGGS